MNSNFKLRSLSEKENYATYLGLPLIGVSRFNFGEDFVNSYFTINGQIAIELREMIPPYSITKLPLPATIMYYDDRKFLVFKVPNKFEGDIIHLLNSKYSLISDEALDAIENYSGLHFNFRTKEGDVVTHRLVRAIRRDDELRMQISEFLDAPIAIDAELEPPMREQDIMFDIDTDLDFIHQGYGKETT